MRNMKKSKSTLATRLREAVIRENQKSSDEQFQALIKRGAIDRNGKVLIVGPGADPGRPSKSNGKRKLG